ncbi:MAG: hypothetical protein K1X75_14225 [Leptospirales bacterium]|nr:hypothetical protein [Leptospirales bacterium]
MNQTPCPNYAMPLPEGWQHALNPLEGISLVLWPKSAGFQNADRRIFVIIRPSTETPAEFQRADAEQHRSAGRIVEVLKTESISSATMGPLVQSALLQQVRIHTAQQESFDQMITLSVKGAGASSYIFNTWLACETRQCFDQWAERHKTAIAGRFVVFQGAAPGAL